MKIESHSFLLCGFEFAIWKSKRKEEEEEEKKKISKCCSSAIAETRCCQRLVGMACAPASV